jgi:acyl CoA:acetate/3-ketoacid CoA transferase beta subunit
LPIGGTQKLVEGWIPFRSVFDTLAGGRRHVMMGASQIDRYGNSNIANIGPWAKPKSQLLGVRGGPGNTVNNATSFFIPKHQTSVFVASVDMVSGVGYDRAKKVGGFIAKRHDLRRVVTNLAVLDFNSPDNSMRLVSVHPGVSIDDVVSNTGFELVIPSAVPISRPPTAEESAAIETIDPKGLRHREIPA